MRLRPWLPLIVSIGACKPAASPEPEPEPVGDHRAEFELGERRVAWSAPTNMIMCRHYAEPERGDYLWIRLAETSEQDGDAGVRLDIDVCRLTAITGALAPMPAGQHGSHCAAQPGFAIWWHEGDAAYNSGPAAERDRCRLSLDYEPGPEVATLRGSFECEPLEQVEPKTTSSTPLSLTAGEFACEVERVQPAP